MEAIFRKYRPSDYKPLVQMVLGLYSKDGEKNTEMSEEKVSLSIRKLTAKASNGGIFIFEKLNQIIGYSIVNRFWSNEFSGQILYIDELYVKRDFRSHGVGAQFLQFLQTNLENDSVAFMLEAVLTNEKAIRFYKNNGFIEHHNHVMFKI
ncbi:MAG: GNAT family N-acetyltransferase [Bacteroidetes bacterium]|nr:GNAT family N-acetyltransferase [Bacteroidota bacterium]